MKQTLNKAAKKPGSSWSDIVLRHSAVRPTFEHELPRSTEKNTISQGRDYSQLPLSATDTTGLKINMAQACLFTPQRCPFGETCHTYPPRVQAKFRISQPGDKYEQEADRVADQVMRMPEPQVQRKGCSFCKEEDEEKILQTKSIDNAGAARTDNPLIQNVLSSPGQPLDADTRSFMKPRFGQDFSGVRVHVGSEAAKSAREVNARAYTVGQEMVFGQAQYMPGTDEGRRLVAHELVHVGQQNRQSLPDRLVNEHVIGMQNQDLRSHIEKIQITSLFQKLMQRYGHDNSCTQEDLENYIWPAHDHAKKTLDRAIYEVNRTNLDPVVKTRLNDFFGNTSVDNIDDLRTKFRRIREAFDEHYIYRCRHNCDRGVWGESQDNKIIDICVNNMPSYIRSAIPTVAVASLLIHENYHRGLNDRGAHPWRISGGYSGCARPPTWPKYIGNNPDSYACFASNMWFLRTY